MSSNLVCLGRIEDVAQATPLASLLKDNGIHAVVKGFEEHSIDRLRSGLGPTQGIELYVSLEQKLTAQALIDEFQAALEPLSGSEAKEYDAYLSAHRSKRLLMSKMLNVAAGILVVSFFVLTVLQIFHYFSE